MWHHESSCLGVTITRSASIAPGRLVTSAVVAPPAAAASSASAVARVPPSCETPMQTPPRCGRSAASSDWRATTFGGQPPPSASSTSAAIASAPCSEVPHPTTVTSSPLRIAAARSVRPSGGDSSSSRASAGCAATISSVTHGGPERSSG